MESEKMIMNRFYITGVSGVGKSTVIKELQGRGVSAFDIDNIPGLCHWKNKSSGKKAEYYSGIGKDWLDAHDYVCDKDKLETLIKEEKTNLIVIAGVASNQDKYLDLFDKIFLFYCNEGTFLKRLSTREENDFAKEKSEQEQVLSWYKNFENKMHKRGAIFINTEASVGAVANQIISYIK